VSALILYLSPIDETRFKVIIDSPTLGQGEVDTRLPFDPPVERRSTLMKILEGGAYKPQNFTQPGEADWLVSQGVLPPGGGAFAADTLQKMGQALYRTLFPTGSRSEALLIKAVSQSQLSGEPLQLVIKVPAIEAEQGRLTSYPWELMHDGRRFLGQQASITRYIAYEDAVPHPTPPQQINVLLISSAANDPALGLMPLNNQERQAVRKGLETAQADGRIRLLEPEYATLACLQAYLTEHRGADAPHVLHFDGHGVYGRRCNEPTCRKMHLRTAGDTCQACGGALPPPGGYLLFESEQGGADYVSAQELGSVLQASVQDGSGKPGGLLLAVISACRSGVAPGGVSVFNGVAQSLIDHRLPAVVAMQVAVRADAATAFAGAFYRSLGQRDALTAAVTAGRTAMGVDGDQWYRPVLYLRWQDNQAGQLFDLGAKAAPVDSQWRQTYLQKVRAAFVVAMRKQEALADEEALGQFIDLWVKIHLEPKKPSPNDQPKGSPQAKAQTENRSESDSLLPFSQALPFPIGRALIFGEGGSGKSTLLLKLAYQAAELALATPGSAIPIYVRLNSFDVKENGSDELLKMVADAAGLEPDKVKSLWRGSQQPLLFLFDGFNEIGSEYQRNARLALQEFLQGDAHGYVLTSRPDASLTQLIGPAEGDQVIDLVALDEDQIQGYLAQHGLAELGELISEELIGLARNPFMLWALTQTYQGLPAANLPQNTAQLYEKFLERYYQREAEKPFPATSYQYELVKKPVLAGLALAMTRAGATWLAVDTPMLKAIAGQLKSIQAEQEGLVELKAYDFMPPGFAARSLLEEIIQNGVLRSARAGIEFMHQTVQEYFTAVSMANWDKAQLLSAAPPFTWRSVDAGDDEPLRRHPFFKALVMLFGLRPETSAALPELAESHPLLAAHAMVEIGKVQPVPEDIRQRVMANWLALSRRRHDRYRWMGWECLHIAGLRDESIQNRLREVLNSGEYLREDYSVSQAEARNASPQVIRQFLGDQLKATHEEISNDFLSALEEESGDFIDVLLVLASEDTGGIKSDQLEPIFAELDADVVQQHLDRLMLSARERQDETAAKNLSMFSFRWEQIRHKEAANQSFLGVENQQSRQAAEALMAMPDPDVSLLASMPYPKLRRSILVNKLVANYPNEKAAKVVADIVFQLALTRELSGIGRWLNGFKRPELLMPLISARLADADEGMRTRAAIMLGYMNVRDVAPELVRLLKNEDKFVRMAAAGALGRLAVPEASGALIAILQGETSARVLTSMLSAAGNLPPQPELVQALAGELVRASKRVVVQDRMNPNAKGKGAWGERGEEDIHKALEKLGAGEQVIAFIQGKLEQGPAPARAALYKELARWWPQYPQAMALLNQALQAGQAQACAPAAEALKTPAENEDAALINGMLEKLLANPDQEIRSAALEGLSARRRDQAAVDLLAQIALSDTSDALRKQAANALRKVEGDRALDHFIQLLSNGQIEECLAAADALAFIQDPAAEGPLQALLADERENVRFRAARALILSNSDAGYDQSVNIAVDLAWHAQDEQIWKPAFQFLSGTDEIFSVYDSLVDALFSPLQELLDQQNYQPGLALIAAREKAFADNLSLMDYRALFHFNANQFDLAAEDYALLVKSQPDVADWQINQVYCLDQLGRTQDAYQAAKSAAEAIPENVTIQKNFATCAYKAGQNEAALKAVEAAIELDAEDFGLPFLHGLVLLALGEDAQAEETYREALDDLQNYAPANRQELLQDAINDLDDLEQRRPELAEKIRAIKKQMIQLKS
jgi:HEAT repeat protein/Flp pilus assembly protein TadD